MTRGQLEQFIWQQIPRADPRAVAEIMRAADSYRLHSPWPLHPEREPVEAWWGCEECSLTYYGNRPDDGICDDCKR